MGKKPERLMRRPGVRMIIGGPSRRSDPPAHPHHAPDLPSWSSVCGNCRRSAISGAGVVLLYQFGQCSQIVENKQAPAGAGLVGKDVAPRATANQRRLHAGLLCRADVVVYPVADV